MMQVSFDVMLGDRFVCSMRCEHNPIVPLSMDRLQKLIVRKYPSLRGKEFIILFNKSRKQKDGKRM